MISTISTGIRSLLERSTPFSTPNATTISVIATKMKKKISGSQVEVIKPPKYSAANVDSLPAAVTTVLSLLNSETGVVKNAAAYFTTQPPITQ